MMATASATPRFVWRGPTDGCSVCLTFDDGPHPDVTPMLLDVLGATGSRATFFLLGERAATWPDLVARIRAAGHGIGSHGYRHRRVWWGAVPELGEDLSRTEAALGEPMPAPRLFRPPYGMLVPNWYRAARLGGYTCVGWNVNSRDWLTRDAQPVYKRLARKARPGALVLLHECNALTGEAYAHTVDAAGRYLDSVAERGWRSVAVGEEAT